MISVNITKSGDFAQRGLKVGDMAQSRDFAQREQQDFVQRLCTTRTCVTRLKCQSRFKLILPLQLYLVF